MSFDDAVVFTNGATLLAHTTKALCVSEEVWVIGQKGHLMSVRHFRATTTQD